MREVLGEVVKTFSPHSDISVKDYTRHYERVRQNKLIAKAGQTVGMATMIPTLDYHYDGLIGGRLIAILGRPGEGKSVTVAWLAAVAMLNGEKIGIFSPEMDEFEHTCRLHTILSAFPKVQKDLGLSHSYRNRDLMRGTNFNMKDYKKFCEYIQEELPGECFIFTKKYRTTALTPQYIASRIEDLGLNGVVADPFSKITLSHRRKDDRLGEAYDKVGALQELGEENNVFVVATNWSTRQQGIGKSEKAPNLDDSFGSDALAQEADHVIGLKHDAEDKTLTMRCTKSRFSKPRFNVFIDFHPNTGGWSEFNIEPEVLVYRKTLNGKSLPNGTLELGKETAVDKS